MYTYVVQPTDVGTLTNVVTVSGTPVISTANLPVETATDSVDVTVEPVLTAAITYVFPVDAGVPEEFTGQTNGNVPTLDFTWSLVGGSPSSDGPNTGVQTTTTTYPTPGIYTVDLTVESPSGQVATDSITVTVYYPPLVCQELESDPNPAPVEIEIDFNAIFTTTAGAPTGPITYDWDFGDNQGTVSDGGNPYNYNGFFQPPGTYTVTAYADNGNPAGPFVCTTTVEVTPLFEVTKSATPPSGSLVQADDIITYTMIISNVGGVSGILDTFIDSVDPNLNILSGYYYSVNGGVPTQVGMNVNGQDVTLSYPLLAVNSYIKVVIPVQVDANATPFELITNTAGATHTHNINNGSHTEFVESNPVTHTVIPDMELLVNPSEIVVGEDAVFTVTHSGGLVNSYVLDYQDGDFETWPTPNSFDSVSANPAVLVKLNKQFADAGVYHPVVTGTYAGQPFTATTTITVTSGFTIAKDANPAPGSVVGPGQNINYSVVLTWDGGTGANDATGVVITDTYDPGQLSLVTVVANNYNYSGNVNVITSTPGLIVVTSDPIAANPAAAPRIELDVIATVVATQPGIIENMAEAMYDDAEFSFIGTDTVTHEFQLPSLEISKVAEPPTNSEVIPGDTITYTVTVTNTNPNFNVIAAGVVVTDVWTVDPDVAPSASGISSSDFIWSPVTIPGSTAAWRFSAQGPLLGGSSISFQITATVQGTVDGAVITNSAVADAFLLTPTLESVVSHTLRVPSLEIAKSANPASGDVKVNDPLVYTIVVNNPTIAPAFAVTVTDDLPLSEGEFTTSLSDVAVSGDATGVGTDLTGDILTVTAAELTGGGVMTINVTLTGTVAISNPYVTNQAMVEAGNVPMTQSNVVSHTLIDQPITSLVADNDAKPSDGGAPLGTQIQFTATTNPTATVTAPSSGFLWEFAGFGTSNQQNPLVGPGVFNVAGTYVVTVTATYKGPGGVYQTIADTTTVQILPGLLNFDKEIVETNAIDPDPDVVYPGDLITYTIGITNDGGFDLSNMVFTDTLDQALVLDSPVVVEDAAGNPYGVTPVVNGNEITIDFGTFPYVGIKSVADITFRVQVSDTYNVIDTLGNGYVIENSAQVKHDNTPVVVSTNIVTNVLYEPPILLDLSATPNPVIVGRDVALSGTLQAPARVFTVTWDFGDSTASGPTAQVDPYNPNLAFNRQYGVPGIYTATLTAQNGHYSSPVLATVVITVTPDFQLLKVAEPASGVAVLPGETITYTVVLTNGAGSGTTPPLSGIVLTDALPAGTQFVTGSVVNGLGTPLGTLSESGGMVVYNVGSLPDVDGGLARVIRATIVVTVTGAQGDILTNTAYGSYNGFMPDFGPATTVHPVGAAPRLEISKVGDPTGASTILNRLHAGDLITYTIRLVNNGPATPGGTATNVVITDTLPAMVDLVDAGLGTVGGNVITWVFPSLAGGGTAIQDTVVVSVSEAVNAQTETIVLTNVVEAISDQTALISDTTVHYADPLPILEISQVGGSGDRYVCQR
jgi:uncharacterized repeat protein (TIGR01451 family)